MSNSSDQPLFSRHEHALDKNDQPCPECGSKLYVKQGKTGVFWGCSQYPACQYTQAINEHERVEDKILEGSECPLCQHPLAVKQGRYGIFIGCSNYPHCHYIAEEQSKDVNVVCPQCQKGELHERISRYGKTFYACDQYPQCKYIVNYPPVQQSCPQCYWSILIKRTMASGAILVCPQKKCDFKQTK